MLYKLFKLLRRLLLLAIIFCLSFSHMQMFVPTSTNPPPLDRRLQPTSFLNGIRGICALIVFIGHYTERSIGWFAEPYGLYEDGAPSSPLQLPFVRILYASRCMVPIFFIISGWVTARPALQLIHTRQFSALAAQVASSTFRRPMRFFIPTFFVIIIHGIVVARGISDERYAIRYSTLQQDIEQVRDTLWKILQAIWAISDPNYPQPAYNPALWTIPVEFSQCMILNLVIIALSRSRVIIRVVIVHLLFAFCIWSDKYYTAEFLFGMILAEIHLLQQDADKALAEFMRKHPSTPKPHIRNKIAAFNRSVIQAIWVILLVFGLFIASWPNEHGDEAWGIRWINALIPIPSHNRQRVWFFIAAMQIVASISQIPVLCRFFENRTLQYLGTLSFSIYLTHNLCLTILQPLLGPVLDDFFSMATFWGRHGHWACGLMVYLPFALWLADLYHRLMESRLVRFGKWVWDMCGLPASRESEED